MTPEKLPVIPSPPAHLWRQFRVRALPVVAFVSVLGTTLWLWSLNQANPLVMGTAQGLEADVVSSQSGRLVELRVTRYQALRQGELVAVLHVADPQIASNTLAVLRAEMELVRTEGGYDAGDKVRYGQFRLDWMLERAKLASLEQQLTYADKEYRRAAELLENKIAKPSVYDVAKRDLDQARESVDAQSAAVKTAESTLNQLDPRKVAKDSPAVRASLDLLEAKLRLEEARFKPILLTSPIDGRVSKVSKLPGTTVREGETIVTVASPKVDYILGYIGQPLRVEPVAGQTVEVRSRGLNRSTGQAHVLEVGPRIELFNAPLRVRGMGNAQERGLPILVSIPTDMQLRPGELVDLRLPSDD